MISLQQTLLYNEITPCTYGYLIFDKEARIYNGAKKASSTSGAGKTGELHVKELN